MIPNLFRQRPIFMLHRAFARLHRGMTEDAPLTKTVSPDLSDAFKAACAEYAARENSKAGLL